MPRTTAAEPGNGPPVDVLVAGEALIDFVQTSRGVETAFVPSPGGSPLNVAVGLARLGVSTGFLGRLSSDLFGEMLHGHLRRNGVDLRYVEHGAGPTTLAFVVETPDHEPAYAFYANGAEDRQLDAESLPDRFPSTLHAIHFGSYSLAIEPIGTALASLMAREHGRRLLSLDPNVRPSIIGDLNLYRDRLLHWIDLCDVIKLSRADAEIVWPGCDPVESAHRWLERGPRLVVVTAGRDPAVGVTRRGTAEVAVPPVDVVDTVGAGDAFTAGLLAWLHQTDHLDRESLDLMPPNELAAGLAFAARVAAVTCSRRGATPPARDEVSA
jgi:fructokinase